MHGKKKKKEESRHSPTVDQRIYSKSLKSKKIFLGECVCARGTELDAKGAALKHRSLLPSPLWCWTAIKFGTFGLASIFDIIPGGCMDQSGP